MGSIIFHLDQYDSIVLILFEFKTRFIFDFNCVLYSIIVFHVNWFDVLLQFIGSQNSYYSNIS